MCGRFALNSTPRRIAAHFRLDEQPKLFARYNIAPTQPVAIVRQNAHSGKRELVNVVWGLIPSWAKDPSIGNRMINARCESAATKPGYRGAFKYRRCLVPADGFYEWKKPAKGMGRKQPYYVYLRDGGPLAFAGLWEHWQNPAGDELESCTILTTDANERMKPIHDRMPVILSPHDYDRWLDTKVQDAGAVRDLLRPCPSDLLTMHAVSTYVNKPSREGEQCIEPVDEPGEESDGFDDAPAEELFE